MPKTYDKTVPSPFVQKTDRDGKVTTYEYDALHRMTSRTDGDGTARYTYDALGNTLTAADASETVAFTYDALSQVTSVTTTASTPAPFAPAVNTVGYTYDAAGNRLSITYPDGKAVTTEYDLLGSEQRTSVDFNRRRETVEYYYDKADKLCQIQL